MAATYLDAIVAEHRAVADSDNRSLDVLIEAASAAPTARPFADALRQAEGLGVVAEVKRRSPSKGDLAVELDPAQVAVDYQRGGATCLSVLTDGPSFGGGPEDLAAARGAVDLPVLRKDFTVCAHDIADAAIMGADAVLLIASVLDDAELADFQALGAQLGLAVLVEIHDEADLERAVAVGARMVGVNQRDLETFEVDTARARRLAPLLPDGVIRIAESGVRGQADAAELYRAGYHAVLVGESVVTAGDRAGAVASIRSAGGPGR